MVQCRGRPREEVPVAGHPQRIDVHEVHVAEIGVRKETAQTAARVADGIIRSSTKEGGCKPRPREPRHFPVQLEYADGAAERGERLDGACSCALVWAECVLAKKGNYFYQNKWQKLGWRIFVSDGNKFSTRRKWMLM